MLHLSPLVSNHTDPCLHTVFSITLQKPSFYTKAYSKPPRKTKCLIHEKETKYLQNRKTKSSLYHSFKFQKLTCILKVGSTLMSH